MDSEYRAFNAAEAEPDKGFDMSYAQERADIESRLQTGWTTTPIAWDNGKYIPTPGTAFIRCTILPGDSEALEFGRSPLKSHFGIIDIGVFVPRETGTAVARGYVDTLVSLFDLEEFGSVECDEASVQNMGNEEDWHHTSITIPFDRRE